MIELKHIYVGKYISGHYNSVVCHIAIDCDDVLERQVMCYNHE